MVLFFLELIQVKLNHNNVSKIVKVAGWEGLPVLVHARNMNWYDC